MIMLIITRRDIDTLDTSPILAALSSLTHQAHGQVELMVNGYDTDKRELWEIPEVCQFFRILDSAWSHWLFFCTTTSPNLVSYLAVSAGPLDKENLDPETALAINSNLEKWFIDFRQIAGAAGWSSAAIQRRCIQINKYLLGDAAPR